MPLAPLISASELRSSLARGAPFVIIDTGFDLADTGAGEQAWREGHVPGAHYLHIDRDLSAPKTGANGRHPLPSRESFAATAGALGIGPDTPVVVYDRQQGMFAVRAWWMLRWLGHRDVAVLDGGMAAWLAEGGALATAVPPRREGAAPYPLGEPLVREIDAGTLAARLGRLRLVDGRAPERFRGDVEPLDAKAGHIPGALNRFFKDNLGPDGRFKPAAQLRADFERLGLGSGGESVVHHCGSGVTACHNVLAMEVAGLGGTTLYAGSWSEWSADPSRPIATG
jgi:thiosulfate/3-mercaptopyruvate sulfurtransferase